ncbi:MAG: flavohemoglobin expression-modulating QEGLA motif protein [Lautropia sp.]
MPDLAATPHTAGPPAAASPAAATRPELPATLLPRLNAALSGPRPLRVVAAGGDRIHVDRDLPFLCAFHRVPTGQAPTPSLARRIAAAGAIHLLWSREDGRRDEPERVVDAVAAAMRRQFPRFLLIEFRDAPPDPASHPESAQLPEFRFDLAARDLAPETDVVTTIKDALRRNEIDYRHPEVRVVDDTAADHLFELGPIDPRIARIAISVPAIHRSPDGTRQYPALFHQMEAAVIDAALRGAMAFLRSDPGERNQALTRMHHRGLGRRAFVQAARTVDRQLTEIAGAYDFLLDLTPINALEALAEFRASNGVAAPRFKYRPLAIAPGDLKRALYSINIGRIEDPTLEDLFREKQLELDHQLTMLQSRNTPAFRAASRLLYGEVDDALLATARKVLAATHAARERGQAQPPSPQVDCIAIRLAAEAMIAAYRATHAAFDATVMIRDDLPPGLMVSGSRLLVSRHTTMSARRLPSLLAHEIGVHLLTYCNGNVQGLRIFRAGLAGYERTQEGLAVFAEFATGAVGVRRLALIAARVLAVHAMQQHGTFVETVRLLERDAGLSDAEAFGVALRVFRSGGLGKDAIYLQGLQQILQLLAGGGSLEPFWFGKISAHQVPVLEELHARGMLVAPLLRPAFLRSERGGELIAAAQAGIGVADLLER